MHHQKMSCNLEGKEKEEKKEKVLQDPTVPPHIPVMYEECCNRYGRYGSTVAVGRGRRQIFFNLHPNIYYRARLTLPYPRGFPEWGAREYQYDTVPVQ